MRVAILGARDGWHVEELCRATADRGARLILVAPLVVELELPLDAHFDSEVKTLKARLEGATAVAASYGVGVRQEIVSFRDDRVPIHVAILLDTSSSSRFTRPTER